MNQDEQLQESEAKIKANATKRYQSQNRTIMLFQSQCGMEVKNQDS